MSFSAKSLCAITELKIQKKFKQQPDARAGAPRQRPNFCRRNLCRSKIDEEQSKGKKKKMFNSMLSNTCQTKRCISSPSPPDMAVSQPLDHNVLDMIWTVHLHWILFQIDNVCYYPDSCTKGSRTPV
ncbi:hypothetical protein HAX54_028457 [Datura stramonium]|uniref:Uncharacterized protein n=1 Tax=Datura stramonium TaxID=4076 RepID=A0ABS8RKP6_DATST|nr:hypothetical protein [Datura stramonium]